MSQSPAGASSDEPGPSTDAPSSSEDSLHIDQPAHAATDAALAPSAKQPQIINATLAHPLALGFTATLGGILAIALAMALNSLSSILVSITLALFIALGLDPIVRSLQRRGLSRALALLVVSVVTVGFFVAVLAIVVPIVARQFTIFLQDLPTFFDDFIGSATYLWLVDNLGDGLSTVVAEVESFVLNPATLGAISGGVLQAGISLLTGLVSALVVIVLTLYFTASLDAMKQAFYRLAPAWSRPRVADLTERITESVGSYLKGMVLLALFNATFVLIIHGVLGLPFGALMAVGAFFITIVPLVGTASFWVIGSLVSLLTDPGLALAFAVIYVIYMEIEAYVLTPRVMKRTVEVPGALVVIGAMIGGTLLGFLGALVAIPVTASILLIVREVVIPRQDANALPGPG